MATVSRGRIKGDQEFDPEAGISRACEEVLYDQNG